MTSQSNTQIGRSMSYRKPVPVYVPSPPPSPTSPLKSLELEETDVPPLPENWREIITTKLQEANSSNVSVQSFQKAPATPESDPLKKSFHFTVRDEEDQKLPAGPPTALKPSHRRYTTRGFQTQYRSPTPPLPSSKSLRMSSEIQVAVENIPSSMLPYNMPASPGPSLENIRLAADKRSLRPRPSFQTDRTVVSHGSTRISTPWRSFGTLAHWEPSSNHPIYPKPREGTETLDARNSSSSLACCGFLGNLIENLKCFWRCK